jgi:hypothetical protein
MKKSLLLFTAALLVLAMLPGQSMAQKAKVFVIHGIPGEDLGLDPTLPVDVAVNDGCALQAFKFGEVVGPLRLDAGIYNIKISVANADVPCGNDAVIEANVPIMAGENATIIAHLTEDGAPTASKFTNDVSPTGNAKSRVILHHCAAAPVVDAMLMRGNPDLTPINNTMGQFKNGDKAAWDTWNGMWTVSFAPWGSGTVVFSKHLMTKNKRVILAYAVGGIATGTFTIIVKALQFDM